MVSFRDEEWLRRTFKDCFGENGAFEQKRLDDFSVLIRHMVRNMERELNQAQMLWEKHPESELLRDKLAMLARCLGYLDRFCRDKIGRKEEASDDQKDER